jgi:photosystem II protein PsbQ
MTLLMGKQIRFFMARQRSIFSLILVLLATFLFACGGPSVATPPPTYTTAQLQQIQEYLPDLMAIRDRSEELETLIEKKEWIKVGNFIHGPMTEARLTMTYIVPHLLPKQQPPARKVTRDLLEHLVKLDQSASAGSLTNALNSYAASVADVDNFLKLLPETKG